MSEKCPYGDCEDCEHAERLFSVADLEKIVEHMYENSCEYLFDEERCIVGKFDAFLKWLGENPGLVQRKWRTGPGAVG